IKKRAKKHRTAVSIGLVGLVSIIVFGSIAINARVTAREQAQLAQSFGEAVNRVESILRFGYTSPLHDVTREKNLVASEMHNIKSKMETLGSVAKGPGHYALGRGYLAQKKYSKAYEHLEEAWRSNYKESNVSRALGLVLGKMYQDSLSSADRIHDKELADERKKEITKLYLTPALQYLKTNDRRKSEDQYYYEGLISLYEKQYDRAWKLAEEASIRKPYFYEARSLQGDVLLARAREKRTQGDYITARGFLSAAQKHYEDAIQFGRSDPEIHGSLCAMWNEVLDINQQQGEECDEPFRLAKASCDSGILADNQSNSLYKERAWSKYLYGTCIATRGENPETLLRQSISDAEKAVTLEKDPVALNLLAQAFVALGEYMHDHGQDPRAIYERAMESAKRALTLEPHNAEAHLNSANASWRNGLYLTDRGENPIPWFTKSAQSYETVLKDVKNIRISMNKGNVYQMMGMHAYESGHDPTKFLQESISSYDQASELNPRQSLSYSNSSASYFYLGLHDAGRGVSPSHNFDRAIEACNKALRYNPSDDFAWTMIGIIRAHSASYAVKNGLDPSQEIGESLKAFEKSLTINPDSAVTLQNMALPYLTMVEYQLEENRNPSQNIKKAVTVLNQAKQIIPEDFWTLVLLARSEMLRGIWEAKIGRDPRKIWEEALSKLNTALQINPNSVDTCLASAELNLTIAEWQLGKKVDAENALNAAKKALSLASSINSENSDVYRLYAVLYKLKAEAPSQINVTIAIQDGLKMAERSLSLNPNNAESIALKAVLLTRTQGNGTTKIRSEEVRQLLEKAFARRPSLKKKYSQYLL
ncbi:hypothetical protein L0156_27105, partial [bacterium]|nr:hypothetical protein [bacterium]